MISFVVSQIVFIFAHFVYLLPLDTKFCIYGKGQAHFAPRLSLLLHSFLLEFRWESGYSKVLLMNRHTFLSICYILLCLSGLAYQVVQVSLDYFAYRTTTKVSLELQNSFPNPAVIFCSRYTDIIDRTNYAKYGIYPKNNYNIKEILSDMANLTIQNIFELTPHPQNVLMECRIRRNNYDLTDYNQTDCYSLFNVTKYVEGGFVCYRFNTIVPDYGFKCDQAAGSYLNENALFAALINTRFLQSSWYNLFLSWIQATKFPTHPGDFMSGLWDLGTRNQIVQWRITFCCRETCIRPKDFGLLMIHDAQKVRTRRTFFVTGDATSMPSKNTTSSLPMSTLRNLFHTRDSTSNQRITRPWFKTSRIGLTNAQNNVSESCARIGTLWLRLRLSTTREREWYQSWQDVLIAQPFSLNFYREWLSLSLFCIPPVPLDSGSDSRSFLSIPSSKSRRGSRHAMEVANVDGCHLNWKCKTSKWGCENLQAGVLDKKSLVVVDQPIFESQSHVLFIPVSIK